MRTVDEVTVPQPGLKLPITALKEITMNSSIQTAQRVPLAFLAAILLTCIWAISTAFAHDQLRSETVKYQDLNVNTSEGIEALYRRIHAAAWRSWAPHADRSDRCWWWSRRARRSKQ